MPLIDALQLSAATESAGDAPKARREKTVFNIDFLSPPEQTAKELFVPASKSSMITLPSKTGAVTAGSTKSGAKGTRTKKSAKRDDHLLPDDMHFTSQQLLRLFLKSKFTVRFDLVAARFRQIPFTSSS